MTFGSRIRLSMLVGGALLLSGCGTEPIDAATAGAFQAEVRTIASTAAAGDTTGAILLAQSLKEEVDGARAAGTVSEDRATLIGMRIDTAIASLEAAQATADEAAGPAGTPAVPPAEPAPGTTPIDSVPAPTGHPS
jgi:hypothetical protein